VAAVRPLTDAQTVRRGKHKGERCADLRPETVERLTRLGRERALIYKTLLLTGLRKGELASLTVAHLNLEPGAEFLQLEAGDEKNREGNAVPLREDLAADLRRWLDEKLAMLQSKAREVGEPIPPRLPPDTPVFVVPDRLEKILDRDLKAAGIPKRDDRGPTIDVHAMRTTFGTLMSRAGVAPRTAQAAMRHSDLSLTMGVYTDPRLLDVRGAVEKLPALPLRAGPADRPEVATTRAGSQGNGDSVTPDVTPTPGRGGHLGSVGGTEGRTSEAVKVGQGIDVSASPVNKKPPVTLGVTGGHRVGPAGFEPTTSCTPKQRFTRNSTQQTANSAFMDLRHFTVYRNLGRKPSSGP